MIRLDVVNVEVSQLMDNFFYVLRIVFVKSFVLIDSSEWKKSCQSSN